KPQWASVRNNNSMIFRRPSRSLELRRIGILDPRVEQGDERLAQSFFNTVQLGERQSAFFELAVEKALHDQVVKELATAARGNMVQSPAGTFHGVGKHDDAGLPRLRFGAGIAKRRLQLDIA